MRPKRLESPKPVPIKIDQPLLDRIERMAGKIGEGKAVVMRMAMRIGLEGLEKAFEANPADIAKLASGLEASKNSSSSDFPSTAKEPTTKVKRPAA